MQQYNYYTSYTNLFYWTVCVRNSPFLCHLFDHDKSDYLPVFVENKKQCLLQIYYREQEYTN